MNKLLSISCGLSEPKKDYSIINKRNLYLNYGLLGLCTILHEKGYDIIQFQGEYSSPEELIEIINSSQYSLEQVDSPVIISIISFLSLDWCNTLTKILKKEYGKTCIVGGKYVVDGNVSWLKNKLPYVDLFIEGDGEEVIEEALSKFQIKEPVGNSLFYNKLDYKLVHNFEIYNPCIEIARGCGRGCVYCADGARKSTRIKDANCVVKEVTELEKMYSYETFNLYFQMATFNASDQWINIFEKGMENFKNPIFWRCTSRVDTLKKNDIIKLSKIGLKVIDLGLESASFEQLIRMGKTSTPKDYLIRAEQILQEANSCGVWVKLNILLTAGESMASIAETINWLERNKELVKGVSVNCETIYGPRNRLIHELSKHGASYVDEHELLEKGYARINLSNTIDFNTANQIAKDISRRMMTADDYFDLKKYGYFSRKYTKEEFWHDIKKLDSNSLPFSV